MSWPRSILTCIPGFHRTFSQWELSQKDPASTSEATIIMHHPYTGEFASCG